MIAENEIKLRRSLGIPDDAERVMIFAESSHWDPDWLYTSDVYYQRFVEQNLNQALNELVQEPRRVYSIECVFFLRMYWERNPDKHELIRQMVKERRLRLTSSGVTTADTLLPSAEAILRDFLVGQQWLLDNGLDQDLRLAYFTDSFGCSPALPSLLRAAGFEHTAITRIDGMYFRGTEYEPRWNYPRPGSSAATLLLNEKSLDFVWRDMNGAKVLCHWNAFSYGQGDLLAYRGLSRTYVFRIAFPDRSEMHIASRIEQFKRELTPVSKTPYLFCPIGFDFVEPIPGLVALLDRYNRKHYPDSGLWVVNAGLDDYLKLVSVYKDELPVLELDPNPYWTGFYASRPNLKKKCHELVDKLCLAEWLAVLTEDRETIRNLESVLEPAWWTATAANHHDFITGTSPDEVVYNEQFPWLETATQSVDVVLNKLTSAINPQTKFDFLHKGTKADRESGDKSLSWECKGNSIQVKNQFYRIELSTNIGVCILNAWGAGDENQIITEGHNPILVGNSNDLISYQDSGGLWRMGHEYRGGHLKEKKRASQEMTDVQVLEQENALQVIGDVQLDGQLVRQSLCFYGDRPLIYGLVEGRAEPGRTITLAFETTLQPNQITMAQPGGVVNRPLKKFYRPTFWPVQEFTHIQNTSSGSGLALFVNTPTAVACSPSGRLELVALRNATREKAYRILPLLGNPASGFEREIYTFEYALHFTDNGDWQANRLDQVAHQLSNSIFGGREFDQLWQYAIRSIEIKVKNREAGFVQPISLKPASQGEGIILRLSKYSAGACQVSFTLREREIQTAVHCNAREQDFASLLVKDGWVIFSMVDPITTIRLTLD